LTGTIANEKAGKPSTGPTGFAGETYSKPISSAKLQPSPCPEFRSSARFEHALPSDH
jgi:hypothetical protein